jgi:hypothetical protein
MENFIIIFIVVAVMGFGLSIFFAFKLLKQQITTNSQLEAIKKMIEITNARLEKIEAVKIDHKSISLEGFLQINSILKVANNISTSLNSISKDGYNQLENAINENNSNLILNNGFLSELKIKLEKIEENGKAQSAICKEGFNQIESALRESIKLD